MALSGFQKAVTEEGWGAGAGLRHQSRNWKGVLGSREGRVAWMHEKRWQETRQSTAAQATGEGILNSQEETFARAQQLPLAMRPETRFGGRGSGTRKRKAKCCFLKVNMCFPHVQLGAAPMAPLPLALFLISGNHSPLLLLFTACDSNFFSLFLGGSGGGSPTFARSLTQDLSWGARHPISGKSIDFRPLSLHKTDPQPCWTPLVSRWFCIQQPGDRKPVSVKDADGSGT